MDTGREKIRAQRNRTVVLSESDINHFSEGILRISSQVPPQDLANRVIQGDSLDILKHLPDGFADLLFLDPPYNLRKNYSGNLFQRKNKDEYRKWFSDFFIAMLKKLKANGSVYVCSDWRTSGEIYDILDEHTHIRNRITWEREKGRGSKNNWKNNSEDIWFCTLTDTYTFNPDAVKLRRRVLAPYKNENGLPKDWKKNDDGSFRMTYSSNIWTDLSVPFWSMPENTDHPTQKPEKLLAKIILASTNPGDLIFDPFMGSGTSTVAAKKLNRRYTGIEQSEEYCMLALKRLEMSNQYPDIQGYENGIFYDRNAKL